MKLCSNLYRLVPLAHVEVIDAGEFIDQHGHEVAHNPSKLEVTHVAPEDK